MKIMKYLLAALVGLLASPVVYARQSNPILGQTDAARNADYLDVYNSDNVTHEIGAPVIYKTGGTYPGVEITTTTTANSPLYAGVIALRDCPATSWCTVQVAGYHSAVLVGVATSAGDLLGTSTTGEKAGVYSVVGTTTTTSTAAKGTDVTAGFGVFAVALEATTSSTTVKVILLGR